MGSKATMKQSGIYRITNLETGAMYIGRTAESFASRWRRHRQALKVGRHWNNHLQRSYDKHGKSAFEYKVLEVVPQGDMTDQEFNAYINEREIHLIAEHDTHQNGYNFTEGGEGMMGYEMSEATKAKLSAALKGKTPSAETRAKMSAAHMGNTHNLGRKCTAETRAKLSKALKGRAPWSTGKKHTAETRAKLSVAAKGKKKSAEAREKMSKAAKGVPLDASTKSRV